MWKKILFPMVAVILVSGCVGEQKKEDSHSCALGINSVANLSMYIPGCDKDLRFVQQKSKNLIFRQQLTSKPTNEKIFINNHLASAMTS